MTGLIWALKTISLLKSFPHGEYVLKVKAANCDGVWNEEGISIKVIIHPPFWATWWFRILVLLFIVGCIWVYIKIRERNLKIEKRKLEKNSRKANTGNKRGK
jgi:hypothetical protein